MQRVEGINVVTRKRAFTGRYELEQGFVEYLERLAGLNVAASDAQGEAVGKEINRAALARLRRTLGKHPDDAAEAFPYVASWVERALNREWMQTKSHESREWSEQCFYLVAALFAFYQSGETRASWHHEDLPAYRSNFGASFLELEKAQLGTTQQVEGASKERAKNLERRFTALLVSRRADLPHRLRHAVSLLKSENIKVDWVLLLRNLQDWRSGEGMPYRVGGKASVQRRWAKSFWRVSAIENEAATLTDASDDETTQKTQEDED